MAGYARFGKHAEAGTALELKVKPGTWHAYTCQADDEAPGIFCVWAHHDDAEAACHNISWDELGMLGADGDSLGMLSLAALDGLDEADAKTTTPRGEAGSRSHAHGYEIDMGIDGSVTVYGKREGKKVTMVMVHRSRWRGARKRHQASASPNLSQDQGLARLKTAFLNSARADMTESEGSYGASDVTECAALMDAHLIDFGGANDMAEAGLVMRATVKKLNDLNERCGHELIETEQREQLCQFINRAGACGAATKTRTTSPGHGVPGSSIGRQRASQGPSGALSQAIHQLST